MIRTALIGLAAAAALTAGANTASAKVHWNVDVNVGLPGPYMGGYYGGGYVPAYDPYPSDCFYIKKSKWVNIGGMWVKKHYKSLVCE